MTRSYAHVPVLAAAVLAALRPTPGHIAVDCPLRLGGHAALLLAAIAPGGTLLGTDFDPAHVQTAGAALQRVSAPGTTVHLRHSNFAALPALLAGAGIERVDSILADLGVA